MIGSLGHLNLSSIQRNEWVEQKQGTQSTVTAQQAQEAVGQKELQNLNKLESQSEKRTDGLQAVHVQKAKDTVAAAQQKFDSYEPQAEAQPTGLYKVIRDGDGNRVVKFDKLQKDHAVEGGHDKPEEAPESEAKKPIIVKTTGSTDRLDKEIESLKQTQRQLEQETAAKDPEKAKAAEAKLAQIEAELRRKDTDAYRRQHMDLQQTVVSRMGE